MTLAHFDREVGAFEENFSGVSHSDSEEQSLCLDDSNGSISSSEVQLRHSFFLTALKHSIFLSFYGFQMRVLYLYTFTNDLADGEIFLSPAAFSC